MAGVPPHLHTPPHSKQPIWPLSQAFSTYAASTLTRPAGRSRASRTVAGAARLASKCPFSTEARHVGSCELHPRCLNKPHRPPHFSAVTSWSLAFRPSVSIPYGNHDRNGRLAHHKPFTFHEGGPIPDKLQAILRVSVIIHHFSPVHEKFSACFYSI